MKVRNLLILMEKRARIIGMHSRITNIRRESERELAGLAASTKRQKLAALRAVARIQFLTQGYDYYGRKKQSPRIISGATDVDGRPPLDGGLTDGGKARLYSVFNWAEREAMMKPRRVE